MSLKDLQNKIGVTPDGVFGPNTLKAATKYFQLSKERSAHFFGQIGHETNDFLVFEENLNYSAQGLVDTFKKYFPDLQSAIPYERQPERIANKVYANRMGNGSIESGDGWKYRGRGAIQLTGKENYKAFSIAANYSAIVSDPDLVSRYFCFESALFYFDDNRIWNICDKGVTDQTILDVTLKVNSGKIGLNDRSLRTYKCYAWL